MNLKNVCTLSLPLLTLLLLAERPASADEFYSQAEVIRSEPLTRIEHKSHLAYECFSKPETSDLVELLHWDLGTGHCAVEETIETITGYRVYYQWDDQLLSHVVAQRPGDYIPVRIEIN